MQEAIVAAVVLYAAWAVTRRYAPLAWKTAYANLMLRTAKRFGWNRLVNRLERRKSSQSSCTSGCDTCGGCNPASNTPPIGEFVVKLDNLKRKNTN